MLISSLISKTNVPSAPALTCCALSTIPSITHAFFTKNGGVSKGIFKSLNAAPWFGEPVENVRENRLRMISRLGKDVNSLITLRHEHDKNIVVVNNPWDLGDEPYGDALLTTLPGIGLGVLNSDCPPVLFYNSRGPIIAAAHCSWKSVSKGILSAVISEIKRHGGSASNTIASIGPGIGPASFEVRNDMRSLFLDLQPASIAFFIPTDNNNQWLFDLPGFIKYTLQSQSVRTVENMSIDNFTDNRFFSSRRSRKEGHYGYGAQLAAIAIRK